MKSDHKSQAYVRIARRAGIGLLALTTLLPTTLAGNESHEGDPNGLLYKMLSELFSYTENSGDSRRFEMLTYSREAEALGSTLIEKERDPKEMESYRAILELVTWAHLKLNHREIGFKYLEKLDTLYPDLPSVPLMKAGIIFEDGAGDLERAPEQIATMRTLLEEALRRDPKFVEAHWLMSQLWAPEDLEKVTEHRRKVIEFYEHRRAYLRLFREDDGELLRAAREWVAEWDAGHSDRKSDEISKRSE